VYSNTIIFEQGIAHTHDENCPGAGCLSHETDGPAKLIVAEPLVTVLGLLGKESYNSPAGMILIKINKNCRKMH
jgi:hypothetical protein